MTELKIEYLSPGEIKPRHRGWRTHKPELHRTLEHSIRTNGVVEPVLIDSESRVVCGSAVVEAATRLGLNRIPVLRVEHLSDAQLRAYALSSAKMAEMSGFDEDILALELQDLKALLEGLDFTNLGFATGELDRILGLTDMELDARIDDVPAARPDYMVSKVSDLWLIGEHRLFNGDALETSSYAKLMDGELAELILSDLPYNLRADTISGNGKFKHGDFVQAAGELSRAEFTRFLTRAMRHMRANSEPGSIHMLFMGWQYLLELLRAGSIVYDELKAIVTWVKKQGGQGAFYRSQTEFVGVFKHGTERHRNNIMMGKYGRNRTTAWFYDGMNTPSAERDELLALHPTVKPVELLADAILDCSTKGSIVLDPFAGSGSIIIAAEKVKRRAFAMELDPIYVDVSLRRIANTLGIDAIRASDGAKFSELDEAASAQVKTQAEENVS
ncbi:DNA modification methylase [Sphingorhabdus sp.]|uniref:DNA modification methylase n=1 Tax=Sphingorhabdus sp. TaxID=1902408 RepID=UPI0035AFD096